MLSLFVTWNLAITAAIPSLAAVYDTYTGTFTVFCAALTLAEPISTARPSVVLSSTTVRTALAYFSGSR